jgi:hypothetical protein
MMDAACKSAKKSGGGARTEDISGYSIAMNINDI